MNEFRERLLDFLTGRLHGDDPELARRIEGALESDPALRAEHDALAEAFAAVALAASAKAPAGRLRLLGELAGARRFDFVLDRFSALFDVAETQAREFLGTLDDPASYHRLGPNVSFRDFAGGPATAGQGAGIVRVAAGEAFPRHRHVGAEHLLVLAGTMRDDAGLLHRAGDLVVSEDDSVHLISAEGDEELVYAVVVRSIRMEPT